MCSYTVHKNVLSGMPVSPCALCTLLVSPIDRIEFE